jgi:proline iminopeptidase
MAKKNPEELKPIEDKNIIRTGKLNVGDGHEIYWVDWGNPSIDTPIFHLHGGPSNGFDEKNFQRFDPAMHRVIFHDQRGSGRSTPFASTKNNTTQDLIRDITKLKQELGFEKISLFGFSWGSTLALLYAIENADSIEKMLIGGIFLARQIDTDFYLNGNASHHFPEAWEKFTSAVPSSRRQNISKYYEEALRDLDDNERKKFFKEVSRFESSIFKLDYAPENLGDRFEDPKAELLAYLAAHYTVNNFFIEENYILNNIFKAKDIPTVIIHGRYDFICMPSAAYELKRTWGDNARVHMVVGGHSTGETVQREVIKAYTNMLW